MSHLLRPLLFLILVAASHGQDTTQVAFDALQKQVDTAARGKDFPSVEALTRAQLALQPQNADAHYNLACAQAMLGKKDEALQTLTKSAAFGFAKVELLDQDADLAPLRAEPAFAAVKAVMQLNQRAAAPGTVPPVSPAPAPIAKDEPGPPMTRQEIIDYLKARIGTDGPHPQKEAVNRLLREEIKKRGVSFRYSYVDLPEFNKAGGDGSIRDAMQANFGTPKPMSWLVGEWNVSTTSTRTFSLSNAVNQMGFLVIEPDGKYLWKVKADDEAKNWIDGKWREPTADEMNWMGGAGVVLLGGEQGYDWIVHRDYTADDGKDWITIAIINSRQTFRSGLRVP